MKKEKVLSGERQQSILSILEKDGSVSVDELAKQFSVSGMTIRRDLKYLEEKNRIERFHGGAILRDEVLYQEKEVQNIEAKKRIAQKALELVKDAKVIFLDAGTTNRELALLLKEREGLSVVTTDLMVAGVLQSGKGRLFFCGGEIQKSTGSALGSYTVNQLKDYSFDIAFLGASSINERLELSTPTLEKVALKKAILQQAKQAVLLADASKFEKQAMMKICSIQEFDILVVAGFQGYNENLEITTLGRGGSDTSAVALAAAIGASCEIYTDVTGVFGTDPRIYKAARQLSQVSYEEMLELSALGAGVLETRCVEIAKNYNVPLYLAKTLSDTKGTWIMANTDLLEKKVVTGVALDRDILHVTLTCSDIGTNFVEELFNQLDRFSVNIDMISQIVSGEDMNVSFTCKDTDRNFLNQILDSLKEEFKGIRYSIRTDCAKVSIVGSGMRDVSGVAARAFRLLCSNGINFYQVTTSEISISYAIDKDISEKAVILLCKEFNI